jgi:hypothetical protein
MSDTTTTTTAPDAAAISAAAEARSLLGQCAHHELLPDGTHRVQLYDRAAGKLLIGTGRTVAAAVGNLRQGRPRT